jgi:hypothetical protein
MPRRQHETAFSGIGITSSVDGHEDRKARRRQSILLRAFGASWPLMSLFARLPLKEPQSSQNNTGFLCGFREFCVDRRG